MKKKLTIPQAAALELASDGRSHTYSQFAHHGAAGTTVSNLVASGLLSERRTADPCRLWEITDAGALALARGHFTKQ